MKTTKNLQITPMVIEVYARGMESVLKLVSSDIKNSYSCEDDLLDHYENLKEAADFGVAMIQSYVESSIKEPIPSKKKVKKSSSHNEEEE